MVSITLRLYKLSRNYRYVTKVLSKEKKELKVSDCWVCEKDIRKTFSLCFGDDFNLVAQLPMKGNKKCVFEKSEMAPQLKMASKRKWLLIIHFRIHSFLRGWISEILKTIKTKLRLTTPYHNELLQSIFLVICSIRFKTGLSGGHSRNLVLCLLNHSIYMLEAWKEQLSCI